MIACKLTSRNTLCPLILSALCMPSYTTAATLPEPIPLAQNLQPPPTTNDAYQEALHIRAQDYFTRRPWVAHFFEYARTTYSNLNSIPKGWPVFEHDPLLSARDQLHGYRPQFLAGIEILLAGRLSSDAIGNFAKGNSDYARFAKDLSMLSEITRMGGRVGSLFIDVLGSSPEAAIRNSVKASESKYLLHPNPIQEADLTISLYMNDPQFREFVAPFQALLPSDEGQGNFDLIEVPQVVDNNPAVRLHFLQKELSELRREFAAASGESWNGDWSQLPSRGSDSPIKTDSLTFDQGRNFDQWFNDYRGKLGDFAAAIDHLDTNSQPSNASTIKHESQEFSTSQIEYLEEMFARYGKDQVRSILLALGDYEAAALLDDDQKLRKLYEQRYHDQISQSQGLKAQQASQFISAFGGALAAWIAIDDPKAAQSIGALFQIFSSIPLAAQGNPMGYLGIATGIANLIASEKNKGVSFEESVANALGAIHIELIELRRSVHELTTAFYKFAERTDQQLVQINRQLYGVLRAIEQERVQDAFDRDNLQNFSETVLKHLIETQHLVGALDASERIKISEKFNAVEQTLSANATQLLTTEQAINYLRVCVDYAKNGSRSGYLSGSIYKVKGTDLSYMLERLNPLEAFGLTERVARTLFGAPSPEIIEPYFLRPEVALRSQTVDLDVYYGRSLEAYFRGSCGAIYVLSHTTGEFSDQQKEEIRAALGLISEIGQDFVGMTRYFGSRQVRSFAIAYYLSAATAIRAALNSTVSSLTTAVISGMPEGYNPITGYNNFYSSKNPSFLRDYTSERLSGPQFDQDFSVDFPFLPERSSGYSGKGRAQSFKRRPLAIPIDGRIFIESSPITRLAYEFNNPPQGSEGLYDRTQLTIKASATEEDRREVPGELSYFLADDILIVGEPNKYSFSQQKYDIYFTPTLHFALASGSGVIGELQVCLGTDIKMAERWAFRKPNGSKAKPDVAATISIQQDELEKLWRSQVKDRAESLVFAIQNYIAQGEDLRQRTILGYEVNFKESKITITVIKDEANFRTALVSGTGDFFTNLTTDTIELPFAQFNEPVGKKKLNDAPFELTRQIDLAASKIRYIKFGVSAEAYTKGVEPAVNLMRHGETSLALPIQLVAATEGTAIERALASFEASRIFVETVFALGRPLGNSQTGEEIEPALQLLSRDDLMATWLKALDPGTSFSQQVELGFSRIRESHLRALELITHDSQQGEKRGPEILHQLLNRLTLEQEKFND